MGEIEVAAAGSTGGLADGRHRMASNPGDVRGPPGRKGGDGSLARRRLSGDARCSAPRRGHGRGARRQALDAGIGLERHGDHHRAQGVGAVVPVPAREQGQDGQGFEFTQAAGAGRGGAG